MTGQNGRPATILLVEDNPGDVELTREAFADARVTNPLHVVWDGVKALAFLRREGEYARVPRPDLILLDLNLPRMDGREVLSIVKADDSLKIIPIIILTTSRAEEDILKSYKLNANSYISKPVDFTGFARVVRSLQSFWFSVVILPPKE